MKSLLPLLAALLLTGTATTSASAQLIRLRTDNNTAITFLGTLVDNTWLGATPPLYLDLPENKSTDHLAIVQTGSALGSVADWRGVYLQAYPSGIYYEAAYFTSVPYAAPRSPYGPGPTINVFCDILAPDLVYISINP